MKVPLSGGSPTTLASGQAGPAAIAVDATSVYWTKFPENSPADGTVLKVPLLGEGPSTSLTTLASEQDTPSAIAVDATSVYWTNEGTSRAPAFEENGTVMKATK